MELYRREFQFNQPVFPPDEEENPDDEEEDEDQSQDAVILINGGVIQAREIRGESSDILTKGSTSYVKKRNMINNNVEETKVNFFDPS